ncbi:MAG TPA: hypothetical protein VFM18_00945 [Methanosarcina sp.]|nr:hypothetical protein [Methanosarcina sp.]
MTKKTVINKTLTALMFKGGYITIPRGGHSTVALTELDHPEFQTAEARGWIEVSDHVPEASLIPTVETVVIENPNQGMTEDELKAELSKNKAPKEETTVEALGQGAPAGANAEKEGKVEALGQDSTVDVTDEVESEADSEADSDTDGAAKPTRTRKARAAA